MNIYPGICDSTLSRSARLAASLRYRNRVSMTVLSSLVWFPCLRKIKESCPVQCVHSLNTSASSTETKFIFKKFFRLRKPHKDRYVWLQLMKTLSLTNGVYRLTLMSSSRLSSVPFWSTLLCSWISMNIGVVLWSKNIKLYVWLKTKWER